MTPITTVLKRIALVVAILGLLEGIGWIADATTGFHAKLMNGLQLMEVQNQPITTSEKLVWPGETVVVRDETSRPPVDRNYIVGGRPIPDADASTDTIHLRPGGVRAEGKRAVFVVGGSAAYGYPYPYDMTYAAELNRRLGAKGYHVYNAAQVGWESAAHAPIVERLVDHYDPHALIIFVGNNEWIRWQPTAQAPFERASVRTMRVLAHSRAAAGVQYLLLRRTLNRSNAGIGPVPNQVELMGVGFALANPLSDETFDAALWSRVKQRYLDAFEGNLVAMVNMAKKRNVRVVLCTLPFQYRLAPAWKHPQPESFDPTHRAAVKKAIREAAQAVTAGDARRVLDTVDTALALDPEPPILHYLRAAGLEGLGRPAEAEAAYALCREKMVGNLGGIVSINEVIRRVAASTGVTLVDLRKEFDDYEHTHGRNFNENLIHDDCHPTPEGHKVIAEALVDVLEPVN